MNYSVPYEYVGNYVDVKVTKRTVTVYYKMNQICTHDRLYGRINQYSTNKSHMPDAGESPKISMEQRPFYEVGCLYWRQYFDFSFQTI